MRTRRFEHLPLIRFRKHFLGFLWSTQPDEAVAWTVALVKITMKQRTVMNFPQWIFFSGNIHVNRITNEADPKIQV
jgi:hypothetical protein